MAEYPTPAWLSPAASQGWGDLALGAAKARNEVQMERDRLAQQATQFSIESQQRAQKTAQEAELAKQTLDYNHLMEQQKIAIDTAYKNSELGLRAQDLDIAQKKFDEQTSEAAKRFAANASFQKAMLPVDQGGEGLAPDKASLKYLAPYMTGTQVGKMTAAPPPFTMGTPTPIPNVPSKLGVETSRGHYQIIDAPVTGTNAPTSIPVTGDNADTIGYWVAPPGGGKPHWQPVQQNSGSDLRAIIKARAAGKTSTAVDAKTPPPERKAEGGYKIGGIYKGGLKYIGGPPGDESSWAKVK